MNNHNIEKAINDLKQGKFVVLMDDFNRENEGDLVLSAEYATEKNIRFLMKYGSGMVCVPMTSYRLNELGLKPLKSFTDSIRNQNSCNFSIPVDAIGNGSGISAKDRALVIEYLISKDKSYLSTPGHTFPLRACDNGIYERRGHTEGSLELMKLASLYPAAVISETFDRDLGEPMKGNKLEDFVKNHNLSSVSIDEMVKYKEMIRVKINS